MVRRFETRLGECPEWQRGGTVNPLRKLRRFESCFPHHALFETRDPATMRVGGEGQPGFRAADAVSVRV